MKKFLQALKWSLSNINPFKSFGNAWKSLSSAFENIAPNLGNYATSFLDSYTGAHLTGQQVEANEMQMQNIADQYPKSVEGMQAAGLNPALMYKSGATSAPSAPSATSNGSMSDLMQLIMLPLNRKIAKAQISNIEADTRDKNAGAEGKEITNSNLDSQMKAAIENTLASADVSRSEALYKNLLLEYGMPEAEVSRVLNDIRVGNSSITRNEAEAELARANAAYTDVKSKIDIQKLPYELASMSASARESVARSIVEEFRGAYMRQNNTDVPTGAIASLVGLISNSFHSLEKDVNEGKDGWSDFNSRTLFPFIDLVLKAFGE